MISCQHEGEEKKEKKKNHRYSHLPEGALKSRSYIVKRVLAISVFRRYEEKKKKKKPRKNQMIGSTFWE